jgi:drug/metabolite transporter superfamily protein YnfA
MREIWAYLRSRKKFWLVPILSVLAIFGMLMILAETTAIGPFIYTLF